MSNTRSKGGPVTSRRSEDAEELLSDEEIREKHREDPSKAEEVLRQIKEGTVDQTGIAGNELRQFLRDHG
jgi:hypothetical protein